MGKSPGGSLRYQHRRTGLSRTVIRDLCESGEVPFARFGIRDLFIRDEDLDRAIEARLVRLSPTSEADAAAEEILNGTS